MSHNRWTLALAGLFALAPLQAGLVTYSSLATFLGDVGAATWTQDFEGFGADTSFQSGPLVAGHLTLQQVGTGTFRNFVDVLPLQFTTEGATTNIASMFTDFGFTTVSMGFDAGLGAWGGDFFSVDAEGVTLVLNLVGGGTLTVDVPNTGFGSSAFFGFRTTAGEIVSGITFRSRTNDGNQGSGEGFPLDNIAAVVAVPEQGAGILTASALLLCAAFRRKFRR